MHYFVTIKLHEITMSSGCLTRKEGLGTEEHNLNHRQHSLLPWDVVKVASWTKRKSFEEIGDVELDLIGAGVWRDSSQVQSAKDGWKL